MIKGEKEKNENETLISKKLLEDDLELEAELDNLPL